MIGVEERDTKSGIHVIRIHYTADPMKRSEEWKLKESVGMPGGIKGKAWKREMEIDWTVAEGLGVYSEEFVREWHVSDVTLEPMPKLPLYRGWDCGPTHVSPACVIAQLDQTGKLYVLEEIVTWNGRGAVKQAFIDRFAEQIITKCNVEYPPDSEWIDVADSAAWVKQTLVSEERSAIEIMNRLGIYPIPGPVTFVERRNAMQQRLTSAVGGKPMLIISPTCRMIIEGFQGAYKYVRIGDSNNYDTKRVEKNAWSHIMNALEYVVGTLFVPRELHVDSDYDERERRKRRHRKGRDPVTGY